MVTAIGICAACAGLSPASTGGAIIMSAYQGDAEYAKKISSNKLFVELFAWSVFCVVFDVLLALIGAYGIF
jgi:hypothetical protein